VTNILQILKTFPDEIIPVKLKYFFRISYIHSTLYIHAADWDRFFSSTLNTQKALKTFYAMRV